MASLKAERPAGSQSHQTLFGQAKKEPAGKAGDGPVRAQGSKPAAKKAAEKSLASQRRRRRLGSRQRRTENRAAPAGATTDIRYGHSHGA